MGVLRLQGHPYVLMPSRWWSGILYWHLAGGHHDAAGGWPSASRMAQPGAWKLRKCLTHLRSFEVVKVQKCVFPHLLCVFLWSYGVEIVSRFPTKRVVILADPSFCPANFAGACAGVRSSAGVPQRSVCSSYSMDL